MIIEEWPLDKIKPYKGNPRKIDREHVERLASLIRTYGVTQPAVVTPDGTLVIGHSRVAAAKKVGLKTFPVYVKQDLDEETTKTLRIADNATASYATWDRELLQGEIDSLLDLQSDLLLTGFTEEELKALLDGHDEHALDENPEPADEPAPSGYTVKFSNDQAETVLLAIFKLREAEQDQNIEDARALELVCADFLAGQ